MLRRLAQVEDELVSYFFNTLNLHKCIPSFSHTWSFIKSLDYTSLESLDDHMVQDGITTNMESIVHFDYSTPDMN